jgi:hypothetical protein
MDGMFLLGLGLGALGFAAEAPDVDGPAVERRMTAREGVSARGARPSVPEASPPEESWRPRTAVSLEDEGGLRSSRRTSLILSSGGARREGFLNPSGPAEEPFRWRDAAPWETSPLRSGPNPWDVVVDVEKTTGSWGGGVSGLSVTTLIAKGVMPLGASLGANVYLGLNVDLLGFEEYERARPTPIDWRHGTPRLRDYSTGLGLTIRF